MDTIQQILKPSDVPAKELKSLVAMLENATDQPISLPSSFMSFLHDVLSSLNAGKSVIVANQEEHFSPAKVAEILGVSRSYVSRLIRNGQIKATKVGTNHRVPFIPDRALGCVAKDCCLIWSLDRFFSHVPVFADLSGLQ